MYVYTQKLQFVNVMTGNIFFKKVDGNKLISQNGCWKLVSNRYALRSAIESSHY